MALSFQVQCQTFAEKIDVNLATIVRRSAAQLYSSIIDKWPVDTGYSRRNWQASADPPPTDVIGEPPKKKKGQPTVVQDPLYQSAGAATNVPVPKDATKAWLVNNVVYAEALENGHSKQAPYGAVRISIAELETEWENIVGKME